MPTRTERVSNALHSDRHSHNFNRPHTEKQELCSFGLEYQTEHNQISRPNCGNRLAKRAGE